MDNNTESLLDVIPGEQAPRRRKLLPWWIKAFVWIFMILGGMTVFLIPYGFTGMRIQLALYGIEVNQLFTPLGFVLLAIFLFKGITALALWTEKDAAVILGILDAVLGISLCFFLLFVYPFMDSIKGLKGGFRFELFFLIPYVYKLVTIKDAWDKSAKRTL